MRVSVLRAFSLLSCQCPNKRAEFNLLKHSFVVGKIYQDHLGTYKVVSIDRNHLVFKTADGIEHDGDAELKWRIYRNILSGQSAPHPSPPFHSTACGGFVREEVFPIVDEIIENYSKIHKDLMTHEKMVAAFMEHPAGKSILNRPHDESDSHRAGVLLAQFSRLITLEWTTWRNYYKREKIRGDWAYRCAAKRGKIGI
jgi:hypothetical protein